MSRSADLYLEERHELLRGNRDVIFSLMEKEISIMKEGAPTYLVNVNQMLNRLDLQSQDLDVLHYDLDTQQTAGETNIALSHSIRAKYEELEREEENYEMILQTYFDDVLSSSSPLYNDLDFGIPNETDDNCDNISKGSSRSRDPQQSFMKSWSRITGNTGPTIESSSLLKPHYNSATGKSISIAFKPVKWQKVKKSKGAQSKLENIRNLALYSRYEHHADLMKSLSMRKKAGVLKLSDVSEASANADTLISFLNHLPLFSDITTSAFRVISNHIAIKYLNDDVLVEKGRIFSEVFVLYEGVILQKNDRNENIGSLHLGEILGLSACSSYTGSTPAIPSPYTFQACKEAIVLVIPVHIMNQIIESENFNKYVYYNNNTTISEYLSPTDSFTGYLPLLEIPSSDLFDLNPENIALTVFIEQFIDFSVTYSAHFTASDGYSKSVLDYKKEILLQLFAAYSPEHAFEKSVYDMIRHSKDFFEVDRAGFFVLDKVRQLMTLYGSSMTGPGIVVPLKGIAGFIAQNATVVNIPDCYEDSLFDATMDKRTGYHTKQMLCSPAYDGLGNVAGVLQLINTLDDRVFTDSDEVFSLLVAEQLGKRITMNLASSSSLTASIPSVQIKDTFKVKLGRIVTYKSHNHVKASLRIFHGPQQLGKTVITELYETKAYSNASAQGKQVAYRCCDFEKWMDFRDVRIQDLPYTARLYIEFFSRNNHSLGYYGINIFSYDKTMKSGEYARCHLQDRPLPTPPYFDGTNSLDLAPQIISIEFETHEKGIIYELNTVNNMGAELAVTSEEKGLEWYLSRMSSTEKVHWNEVLATNIHLLTLSSEDMQTVWALRSHYVDRPPDYLVKLLACASQDAAASTPTKSLGTNVFNNIKSVTDTWPKPHYLISLQLLGRVFTEPSIRCYAVEQLQALRDSTVIVILPLLVQLVRYEVFDDNSLTRFLLCKSLSNPAIGDSFYWCLRCGLACNNPTFISRYMHILDVYTKVCGPMRERLNQELCLLRAIEEAGRYILTHAVDQSGGVLSKQNDLLQKIHRVGGNEFHLPIDRDTLLAFPLAEKCNAVLAPGNVVKGVSFCFKVHDGPSGLTGETAGKTGGIVDQGHIFRINYTVLSSLTNATSEVLKRSFMAQFVSIFNLLLQDEGFFDVQASVTRIMPLTSDSYISYVDNTGTSLDIIADQWASLPPGISAPVKPVSFSYGGRKYLNTVLYYWYFTVNHIGTKEQVRSINDVKATFRSSYAAYCVLAYLFGGLEDAAGADVLRYTHDGRVAVTELPTAFKRIGNLNLSIRNKSPIVNCVAFSLLLGTTDPSVYLEYKDHLVNLLMLMRKNIYKLESVYSLGMTSLQVSQQQLKEGLDVMRDNLLVNLSDADAVKLFAVNINAVIT